MSSVKCTSAVFCQVCLRMFTHPRLGQRSREEAVYCQLLRSKQSLRMTYICSHLFIHFNHNFHTGKYYWNCFLSNDRLKKIYFFNFRTSYLCAGLRDPAGNRLTLTYPGGKMYRVSIPLLSECPFITKCLVTLRQVLKKDLAIAVSILIWHTINHPRN